MKTITVLLLTLLFSVVVTAQSAIAIQQYNEGKPTTESNNIFSIVVMTTAVITTLVSLFALGKMARGGGLASMLGDLRSDARSVF